MSQNGNKRDNSSRRAKPSKERFHQSLRVAMWYVYEHRCAYTGEHISGPEHVVIDHVLPERLADDDDERQQALAGFGLPSGFQIRDNLGNLVPTTQAFNALKLDKTQPDEIVPRYAQPYARHRPYEDRQNAHAWPVQALIAHGLRTRSAEPRGRRAYAAADYLGGKTARAEKPDASGTTHPGSPVRAPVRRRTGILCAE